jgi:hypothetical protein
MLKWQLSCLVALLFLIACKKEAVKDSAVDNALAFNYVVVLGNSITYSPPNPAIGWTGDWGMAATRRDSDYVSILRSRFKVKNPNVVVKVKNIIPFEVDAEHYIFDQEMEVLRDSKPDLLMIRIGENVSPDVDQRMFDQRYTALINYFKANNPKLIVLGCGSIWGSVSDNIMMKHPPFVLLNSIVNDGSNFHLDYLLTRGYRATLVIKECATLLICCGRK